MPPELQTQLTSESLEIDEQITPEPQKIELTPENEAALRKQIAIDMRKAELRAKMEAASKARRAKKGFMTPDRKKKLRLLLRRKAAEELRKEQERKAEERRWIIEERCGDPEDLEWASKDDLQDICEYYYQRILEIEADKWDIEHEIRKKAFEIADLNSKVNDLRGKFQRPILKKVSKYENRFAKLQRKAAEFNFRSQLKLVRRHDLKPKDEEKKDGHDKHAEEKKDTHDKQAEDSEQTEESAQGEEKLPCDGEETKESPADGSEERKLPDGVEGEIIAEGAEVVKSEPRLEGEVTTDGEAGEADNLRQHVDGLAEGEQLGESEARLEGEAVQGDPGAEGEERLKEGEGGAEETGLPQEPHHTEEDLWTYLKETVTSVHPSTVEEFVQNLIGTLQHVPEEYLKPVIDANLKRANSPSITDGEHLNTPEGVNPEGEPLPESSSPPEDGVPSADTNTEVTPDNTPLENPQPVEEETAFPSDPESSALPEGPTIPETRTEEPEEEAKSYTALEDDI